MKNYKEIEELLQDSTCAHLADCLEMIPAHNLEAVQLMVTHLKKGGVQKAIYKYQVVQDIAALVSGHVSTPLFSQPFIGADVQSQVCQQCGNDAAILDKVCIPDSDIRYLCKDCSKQLPLNGVVDFRDTTMGTL